MESSGIPFPKTQPMRIYSSLWNAGDWANRGSLVKTDWSLAPFTASYRNFSANACTGPMALLPATPQRRHRPPPAAVPLPPGGHCSSTPRGRTG
ncbi:hypothetical protein MLD38_014904 [Melastoma candidum]|uniref:Uncharacterized protein n=1 Tax=Melastoma candidum TaxID=119954 RepID=A0ACB9RI00_9MYRT|nr:hypothetical protein MLD38_014904 [Melastoma candidum]